MTIEFENILTIWQLNFVEIDICLKNIFDIFCETLFFLINSKFKFFSNFFFKIMIWIIFEILYLLIDELSIKLFVFVIFEAFANFSKFWLFLILSIFLTFFINDFVDYINKFFDNLIILIMLSTNTINKCARFKFFEL